MLMRLGTAVFVLLTASGCVVAEGMEQPENEELDSVSEAQLDPGMLTPWRLYTATFSNGQPFFRALAIGGSGVGSYQAGTEYFYVSTANLQYLGQKSVTFSHTDGSGTPPAQSGSQQFQLPVSSSWTSFSSDPVSGGFRYKSGNVQLRIATGGGEITRLTWYQALPLGQNPANLTPDGTFAAGSGAVTVPSGSAGYYVDITIP
ncbi:hypothetical protein [Sorangium sp. So ce385]|uniref:hypothetical protein n=1 Tax=Sorangium sp. So ce385 TaxID=3133308 RepID=UPI003F5C595B